MIWIRKGYEILKNILMECYLICTLLLFAAVLFVTNAPTEEDSYTHEFLID